MLRLPGLPAKVVRRQNKRIPVDQLPNSTEKRLARTLLLPPPRYGKQDRPQAVLPKILQETLVETIGTTRSPVKRLTNRFKKMAS
jgi:hypothetical protein